MRLRLALVALGLVAVVYGVASLTGGWLGTPPWWETAGYDWPPSRPTSGERAPIRVFSGPTIPQQDYDLEIAPETLPYGDREWISAGVVAAGLALAAFGAWPRRRRPMATTSLPSDRV